MMFQYTIERQDTVNGKFKNVLMSSFLSFAEYTVQLKISNFLNN